MSTDLNELLELQDKLMNPIKITKETVMFCTHEGVAKKNRSKVGTFLLCDACFERLTKLKNSKADT